MNQELLLEFAHFKDSVDPLGAFRDEFVIEDPDLIYLDGNSLGRLPKRSIKRMRDLVEVQWGGRLVRGWGEDWIDLPNRIGAKIAKLIGASSDEVLVCDSTSVNFFKLAMAALEFQKGRSEIVTDSANFPSDVYLLQGCAKQTGHTLHVCEPEQIGEKLGPNTALLTLSHVSFKSGHLHSMRDLTAKAQACGARVLWDLSHSVGALPIELNACHADLAVGCTYKYLNGGPGAPAFLYVRRDLQEKLLNPIWGWFGQTNPFGFSLDYQPAAGIQRFMVGTPPVLSLAAVECGVDLMLEAGIEQLRAKSVEQTEFLIELWRQLLQPLGFSLNSPASSSDRGSHISLGHPNAFQIDQCLIEEMKVIPDFRHPDNIRLGVTPISTTFFVLAEAMLRIKKTVDSGAYKKYPTVAKGVT